MTIQEFRPRNQQRPLNLIVNRLVDEFVSGRKSSFDKDEAVEVVLAHPDVARLREGLDVHDRSEGLEDVFVRDVRRKVTARLRRDGCVAQNTGGGRYRWYPPES